MQDCKRSTAVVLVFIINLHIPKNLDLRKNMGSSNSSLLGISLKNKVV